MANSIHHPSRRHYIPFFHFLLASQQKTACSALFIGWDVSTCWSRKVFLERWNSFGRAFLSRNY